MSIRLTPLQGRIAAIALLLGALAILTGLIALPAWWFHARYDQKIEDYSDQLQRYQRIAAMRPAIDEAIKNVEGKGARKYYLQGASPTLAAAELQRLVTQVVERHKGRISSSQVLPPKEDAKKDTAAKIAVAIQFNASAVPLQLILYALETNEPYLFIGQFSIRSGLGRNYKPIPGAQPEFAVQMTVSAYTTTEGEGR